MNSSRTKEKFVWTVVKIKQKIDDYSMGRKSFKAVELSNLLWFIIRLTIDLFEYN